MNSIDAQKVITAMPGAREMIVSRLYLGLFAAIAFTGPADAQVVVLPHGEYENGLEKYLVVIVSLILLGFAVWQTYGGGQMDRFRSFFRRMFGRQ